MYEWGDDRRFNSYSRHFRELTGGRVQKVAINAGFTCPNRDGTLGTGGCSFCNNAAFTPSSCQPGKRVTRQIDEGIEFHSRRYRRAERYLAYFQSFSNTHAPLSTLRAVYDEALAHPLVAGIVVGTRPDCVDGAKLDYFADLARRHYVAIEYGIESTYDATLQRINRGHDFAAARRAVEMTAERATRVAQLDPAPGCGLHTGAHFILGLPGETDVMLLAQTATINSLPLTSVKFHQLQIFRDTPLADEYARAPERFTFRGMEEYIDFFIAILRRLRPSLVVERFAGEAPPRHRVGRDWGLVRNEELAARLDRRLAELDVHQGDLFGN
jgi:radical SAM protein (TIGR01212 family)